MGGHCGKVKKGRESSPNPIDASTNYFECGQTLGICREHARHMVREYERHLESLEDAFRRKIKELGRLVDVIRKLNVLRGNEFYDGDPEKPANYSPEDLRKIRELGMKSTDVIANAFEGIQFIGNVGEWVSP